MVTRKGTGTAGFLQWTEFAAGSKCEQTTSEAAWPPCGGGCGGNVMRGKSGAVPRGERHERRCCGQRDSARQRRDGGDDHDDDRYRDDRGRGQWRFGRRPDRWVLDSGRPDWWRRCPDSTRGADVDRLQLRSKCRGKRV